MTKGELIAYVQERFDAEPEYLWAELPDAFVFRHRSGRKWFAVAMDVRRDRLGLAGEGTVFVLDVKCGPLLGGSFLGEPGVLPAYHMNKTHWLSVLPDGPAEEKTVKQLLEISYELTRKK